MQWLEWLLADDVGLGFEYSYSVLSELFSRIMIEDLFFPKGFITLGGVRAGGATARFLEHESIERLKFDMRLVGERSVAHYVQSVMGDMVDATLPPQTSHALEELERVVGVGFDAPPPLPFSFFFDRRGGR